MPFPGSQLRPLSWRLQQPPPLAPPAAPEPVLLQLDCRDPLSPAMRDALLAILAPAERQRLDAYRRQGDRERFLLGRAGLRLLLAAWLDRPATAVIIESGAHGKPCCPDGPHFNLSHSGDLILLALHPHCRVGVDVERLRPELDWQPIARRVLSEPQRQALSRLPATARLEGFLVQWCVLEAELKAAGTGFAGLESRRSCLEQPLRTWGLRLPEGYVGAVALMPSDQTPIRHPQRPAPHIPVMQ